MKLPLPPSDDVQLCCDFFYHLFRERRCISCLAISFASCWNRATRTIRNSCAWRAASTSSWTLPLWATRFSGSYSPQFQAGVYTYCLSYIGKYRGGGGNKYGLRGEKYHKNKTQSDKKGEKERKDKGKEKNSDKMTEQELCRGSYFLLPHREYPSL